MTKLRYIASLTCALLALSACADAEETASVSGSVLLPIGGSPVSGVTISSSTSNKQVISDADGNFKLSDIKNGTKVVLTAQAPGFAAVSKAITAQSGRTNAVQLFVQPTATTTITLPSPGESAVAVTAGNPNRGSATLSIPPSALMTADGTVATGSADVSMAYWDFDTGRLYGPLPLLATGTLPSDPPRQLSSRGMADIKVMQNGQELKVAPGQHVNLSFYIPPALQPLLAANLQSGIDVPHLFSGDTNQAMWVEEGSLADGALAFDSNSFSFVGTLTHMSSWNLDILSYQVGGCVQGTVLDSDMKPVKGATVHMFFLSVEEVADYITPPTDENGNYCMNIGTNGGVGDQSYQTNYYLSSSTDIEASNMCDPMPQFCKTRGDETRDYPGQGNWVQQCSMRNDAVCSDTRNGDINGQPGTTSPDRFCHPLPTCDRSSDFGALSSSCHYYEAVDHYAYIDSCTPASPLVQIEACHFCPGTAPSGNCSGQSRKEPFTPFSQAPVEGGCGVLKTITFHQGDITADPPAVGSMAPVVCQANSPTTKHLGDACVPGVDTCCPVADMLVCEDLICVPAKDG